MQAQQVKCECGSTLSPYSYYKHLKSSLHDRRLSAKYNNDIKTPKIKTQEQKDKNKLYQQRPDIKTRRAEKLQCQCGATISRGNMKNHLSTQLHINNLNIQTPKARRAEKLPCKCGAMVSRGNMKNHLKLSRHINNLKRQEEEKLIIKCPVCPKKRRINNIDEHNKTIEHQKNLKQKEIDDFMNGQMNNNIDTDSDIDYDDV